MSNLMQIVLQVAVLAYAVVGGVFLAFSDFIMRALALTSGQGGAEAMQVINREVFRWVFMALFLGMAAASVLIAIASTGYIAAGPGVPLLTGALVYLLGCFAVTVFANVPMNEALAGMDVATPAARDYWSRTYVPRWTWWNSVRAVACLTASGLMLIGLVWLVEIEAKAL